MVGILPALSWSWATLVLKPGALIQICNVCLARNARCLLDSDPSTLIAFLLALPLSVLRVNGQRLPEQRISALKGLAGGWVITSPVSLSREPLTVHFVDTPDVTVGNGSEIPSQFSSMRLPLTSRAPGRMAALPSLQSWPAKNPS